MVFVYRHDVVKTSYRPVRAVAAARAIMNGGLLSQAFKVHTNGIVLKEFRLTDVDLF